jgi:hypothetical protein
MNTLSPSRGCFEKGVVDVRIVEAVPDHHQARRAHAEVALELGEVPFEHLLRLNGEALAAADHDQIFAGAVVPAVRAVKLEIRLKPIWDFELAQRQRSPGRPGDVIGIGSWIIPRFLHAGDDASEEPLVRLEARDCTVTYRQGGRKLAVLTIGCDRASLATELELERIIAAGK